MIGFYAEVPPLFYHFSFRWCVSTHPPAGKREFLNPENVHDCANQEKKQFEQGYTELSSKNRHFSAQDDREKEYLAGVRRCRWRGRNGI